MEQFFLNKKIVEYACLCGILSPLTRLYFCRHCLNLRCAFCCHHEVSILVENQIMQIVTHFNFRSIPIFVRTASKTFHRRRLSWGRTSATPASTAHHVSRRYQLEPRLFRFQWHPKARAGKNLPKAPSWSRRRCITWRASLVAGHLAMLVSAIKHLRLVLGRNRNIFTTLASSCCRSTSRQSFCMTSKRSWTSFDGRQPRPQSFPAWR